MDPFDSSVDDHNRGEVGVGVARHVYGPANVHLLPCKIHHTGSAPVATYFRPKPTPHETRNIGPTATDNGSGEEDTPERDNPSDSGRVGEEGDKTDQAWEHFDDDATETTARFRGRRLMGRKVQLPEGVYGAVLREQPCPERVREDHEDLKSFWAAETSFRDVTVWGHDEVRRESTVDRCLAWLEVSKSHEVKKENVPAGPPSSPETYGASVVTFEDTDGLQAKSPWT